MSRLSANARSSALLLAGLLFTSMTAAAGEASGILSQNFKSGQVTVKPKHAYLVSGPDFDGRSIRQLILSETDLASAIQACDSFACATWDLLAGASVKFDGGARLGYWLVADGQRKQHSGVAKPESMTLSVDTQKRLTGSWTVTDDGQGTTASVKFDAPLVKTFRK